MKQFAVIGLGNFGARVVKELTTQSCKVTAIDNDRDKVQALEEHPHLVAIFADATDRKFLENLGVEQFDAIVASTGKDSHATILIALHLRELNAKRIIIKANSQDHAKILLKVGATEAMIPEEQMAIKLSHSLARPNVIDYLPLAQDYHVAELVPPEKFFGKTFMELSLRSAYHIQVIAIKDSKTGAFHLVPGAKYTVKPTDILVVLGKEEDINHIRE
jgi:trk system potassium uptake protein TrkA